MVECASFPRPDPPVTTPTPLTYRDAGVDIDAGNEVVERIKPLVKRTFRPEVMGGLGGFGALFDLSGKYREPVLVSGTDGVGTKLKLAQQLGRHDTIGIDLVAMCVNDVLVQGAEPLFFLDYFATGKLDVDTTVAVVGGIARGCELSGCALIGGETAEMPDMYGPGEYDLAGFCVAAVEKSRLLDGAKVRAGDVLFRRGELGTTMYVVVKGAIDLDFGDDLIVKRLGPAEFFGELGLLIGDHARSAEASVPVDGELLELHHEEFQRLVEREPGMVCYFLRRAIMRVVLNEQGLIRRLRRRNQDLEAALDNLRATAHQLQQTEVLIRTDDLTGLANRRQFDQSLRDAWEQARRSGQGIALLMVDIDCFKAFNDRFGHPADVVVQRYEQRGIPWVQTPDCGAARWRSDQPDAMECERHARRRYWHHPGTAPEATAGPVLAILPAGEKRP